MFLLRSVAKSAATVRFSSLGHHNIFGEFSSFVIGSRIFAMSPERANSSEPVAAAETCHANRSLLSLAHILAAKPTCFKLETHEIRLASVLHTVDRNGYARST